MKIFVLNSSGNVGKSLITRELFYPRLKDPLIIEVETVNKGSKEMEHLNVYQFKSGEDFTEIYLKMMENENVIMDVGASNLAAYWEQLKSFAGVDQLFDLFIIPTVPAEKEMNDTYKTIEFLRSEGIPDEKIKVIFNRVKRSVSTEFAVLLAAPFDFDQRLFLTENRDLFNDLGFLGKTIRDIYTPDLDSYKAQILSAADPKEKIRLIKMDLSNRQAVKVKEDMDVLYGIIAEQPSAWVDEQPVTAKPKTKPKAKKETKKEVPETAEDSGVSDDDEEL